MSSRIENMSSRIENSPPAGAPAGARKRLLPRGLAATPLTIGALIAAALIAFPIFGVLLSLLQPTTELWPLMAEAVLPRYIGNTLLLAGLVALGVAAVGVPAAWLVTMYSFPGRAMFELALALPLAFPAYVIAYAYTDLLDHPGAVQTALRELTGWGPRDYWFPEIRSLEGAAAMLILVLYPYVYLLARASFLHQSVSALDVARTLGAGPYRRFFMAAVPMARPAIVTGVTLALMETLADFGTVAHFGVQTFATGIYRAWFSMGDRIAAAQLSACLLMGVMALIMLERIHRRESRFQTTRASYQPLPQPRLTGFRATGAMVLCALPALCGFVIPLAMLVGMSVEGGHDFFGPRYLGFAFNSLTLAGMAGVIVVALAVLMAYAARLAPGKLTRGANVVASMGYAIPGSVIAVGLLIPLAGLDNALDSLSKSLFGVGTGLLFTGSVVVLLMAYAVRFMSVALQTVESALDKVTPSMDHAARALGETSSGALKRVHVPMMRGGLLTAVLIVFVDVMKELPATLILRPFDFETLATQAYRLASDERLLQASTPSLAIGVIGLIPVLLLTREIRRSRPGHGGG